MRESVSKTTPQFTPEWNFMNNPKFLELQLCLDACYYGIDPETQNDRNLTRAKFANLWPGIFKKYSKTKSSRALLIKFIEKNLRVLDAGGIAKGNDSQISALKQANSDLVQKYPIEHFWD